MYTILLASALLASQGLPTKATPITQPTCANLSGARLFSQEDDPVYLGFFGSSFASESVNNTAGSFGSSFRTNSIRNNLGRYGSNTSSTSHFNNVASRPPIIVKDGYVIGLLTVNNVATAADYPGTTRVTLAEIDAACQFSASRPSLQYTNQTGAGGLDVSVSGFWWNPNRSGEGLLLEFAEINGAPFLFAIFFSYDPTTRQPVFIAGGAPYSRSSIAPITFDVSLTTGGRFGPAFNPSEVQRPAWGKMTVTVNNCASTTLSYESVLPAYGTGSIQMQRFLESDAFTTCP